jgi:hypothetical protein
MCEVPESNASYITNASDRMRFMWSPRLLAYRKMLHDRSGETIQDRRWTADRESRLGP